MVVVEEELVLFVYEAGWEASNQCEQTSSFSRLTKIDIGSSICGETPGAGTR